MFAHSLRSVPIAEQEPIAPRKSGRVGVAFLVAALLGGCAGFSGDQGMDAVSAMTHASLQMNVSAQNSDDDIATAQQTVTALLKHPLGMDAAVQIALLNNRDLQAAYNELGIAEAARVRASMPANPRFNVSRVAGGGAFEFEAQIVANILSLATLPARPTLQAIASIRRNCARSKQPCVPRSKRAAPMSRPSPAAKWWGSWSKPNPRRKRPSNSPNGSARAGP